MITFGSMITQSIATGMVVANAVFQWLEGAPSWSKALSVGLVAGIIIINVWIFRKRMEE